MTSIAAADCPVRIRDAIHRAPKVRVDGAERAEPLETTLARVLPHARTVGLTRLADVTGLDRIGIPVVLAVRPNSASLSVDAGKGVTEPAATASAVMECFERHAAEVEALERIRASYDEIAALHPTPPFERLPFARNAIVSRSRPEEWALGWDLIGRRDVALPAQTIGLRRAGPLSSVLPFQTTSNGLSAGSNVAEALLGGLLEVVERDALACHRLGWERAGRASPRIDPSTIAAEAARVLLDRYADAAVEVAIFDLEVDTGVPVYMAYIWDPCAPQLGIYRGYGAHLDPVVAVTRALAEAAQSRLVYIAGSRDDALRHHRALRRTNDREAIASIDSRPATYEFGVRASELTATFEGDVAVVLGKLVDAGLDQVVVYDLTEPGLPASVLRVAVPGLEGYMFDSYRPGPRALAYSEAA